MKFKLRNERLRLKMTWECQNMDIKIQKKIEIENG